MQRQRGIDPLRSPGLPERAATGIPAVWLNRKSGAEHISPSATFQGSVSKRSKLFSRRPYPWTTHTVNSNFGGQLGTKHEMIIKALTSEDKIKMIRLFD